MTMASIANETHHARLSCRIDVRIKQRAEEAAALLGGGRAGLGAGFGGDDAA